MINNSRIIQVKKGSNRYENKKNDKEPITHIIVDLTNVLFLINVRSILKSVGVLELVWYILTKWKNPETTSLKFLDDIHNASSPQYPLISYKNYKMPDAIVANLLGFITTQDVLTTVKEAINDFDAQNYFKDEQEKKLITSLMETMFNLTLIKQNMRPNIPLINFLTSMKDKHEYKLFLLTNVGKDTYQAISQKYPEVFALFDGTILSADVQELKPYPPIYRALLDTYQFSPETSVFIDDQEDNIEAARALGFNGIVYKNQRTTEKELAKLGIH